MTSPGWILAGRATRTWILLLVFIAPLLLGISAAERGGTPAVSWGALLQLLSPGCAAAAVALTVVGSRLEGSWDGWTSLGVSPHRRLFPLVIVAGIGAILLSGLVVRPLGPRGQPEALSLPAPVEEGARVWLQPSGWGSPDLSSWKTVPAALSTAELVVRLRRSRPSGARRGTDWAELMLRVSAAASWILAIPLGFVAAHRHTRARNRRVGAPGVTATLEAVGCTVALQLGGFVVAVYASSMM